MKQIAPLLDSESYPSMQVYSFSLVFKTGELKMTMQHKHQPSIPSLSFFRSRTTCDVALKNERLSTVDLRSDVVFRNLPIPQGSVFEAL